MNSFLVCEENITFSPDFAKVLLSLRANYPYYKDIEQYVWSVQYINTRFVSQINYLREYSTQLIFCGEPLEWKGFNLERNIKLEINRKYIDVSNCVALYHALELSYFNVDNIAMISQCDYGCEVLMFIHNQFDTYYFKHSVFD